MGEQPVAPGARALALTLLIGLIGVLAGRAIWAGEETAPAAPGTNPAPAAVGPATPSSGSGSSGLDAVIARSSAGLGNCLNDVAGSPAPPNEQTAKNQEQFITILSGQLEQLRGLDFRHPVDAQFLTGPQIEKRIGQLINEQPTPADASQAGAKLLSTLGAIKPGDDPAKIEKQALKGQVAGLYVPETGELLVRSGKSINVTDTITVVHELDHALTDQALGGIREKFGKGPGAAERQGAYSALVEGDATITMEAYLLRHGSVNDQLDMLSELGPANKAQADLETYPYYFQRQLLFPYLDGLRFDCALYAKGGWKAVDAAYRKPPRTTAEVMFPGRYGEKPKRPPQAVSPGPDWKRSLKSVIGAADLEWLFAAPGDDTSKSLADPRGAAAAWDGGEVTLWSRGRQTAVAIALRSRAADYRLCHSVAEWYAAFGGTPNRDPAVSREVRFHGKRQSAELRCSGRGVVKLGIGPTPSVAGRLFPAHGVLTSG